MLEIIRKGVGLAILSFSFIATTTKLQAQNQVPSALERIVSVNIYNEPAKGMLDLIGKQTNVVFSYSPKVLENRPPITLEAEKQSIRLVLFTAFGETVKMKSRGKYIILTDNRNELKQPFGDKPQVIEGYITNPKTGEAVSNATVYDQKLLLSAVTDEYGYFKVEVPYGELSKQLQVKKQGFADTTIVPTSNSSFVLLKLPATALDHLKDISKKGETFITKTFPKWLLSDRQKTNSLNVGDTIYRNWQVSLLPYIGTNRQLSGNVVNKYSYNIFAGYSMGVRVMEVSSGVNIVRGDARYFMAGGANYVGGHMKGVQLANVFNRTQSVNGVQAAGLFNYVAGNVQGVQLAGVFNHTVQTLTGTQVSGVLNKADTAIGTQVSGVLCRARFLNGTQASGVANIAKGTAKPGQVAGVVNYIDGSISGVQLAGVANTAKQVVGMQASGVANRAETIRGAQLSGIYNQADTVIGIQSSGIINRTKVLKGAQFGLVNLTDSGDGVAFGLFCYNKKGIHQLEVAADELFYTNITFRTGSRRFHNLLTVGVRPDNLGSHTLWTYGYGFGTSLSLYKGMMLDADLYSNNVIAGGNASDENQLYRIYLGFDKRIGRKTSLAFGITTNLFTYKDTPLNNGKMLSDAVPYTLWNKMGDDGRTFCGWIGGRVALRF
ncbi:peptidase associated/transthyretin-like domain-containing protein [Acetobacteroides hydrogenigenes]|uniref:Carboxypeptidase-like protein n=1 Tax=Acetobacteroides hydrogenigenes TaxID=979970 RepID=A0A4R2ETV5_9BACT|nr:hypothetical protein [Acetobacteroides hydrogenigenes]TCN72045.1 hypothetical protein CLV25_1023 [Acetobacteroides hydrogenigenes]